MKKRKKDERKERVRYAEMRGEGEEKKERRRCKYYESSFLSLYPSLPSFIPPSALALFLLPSSLLQYGAILFDVLFFRNHNVLAW